MQRGPFSSDVREISLFDDVVPANEVVNVKQGSSATFEVTPLALTRITYTWLLNNRRIPGANGPLLTLSSHDLSSPENHLILRADYDTPFVRADSIQDEVHWKIEASTIERNIIGEVGRVFLAQAGRKQWHSITFRIPYTNPVVVMPSVSHQNRDPVHVRIRNVTSTGCEFQLEEWSYLNGRHGRETVAYWVVEAGRHQLSDGKLIEAGHFTANTRYRTVRFSKSFDRTPAVFASSKTLHGKDPIITRIHGVRRGRFLARVQEEEAGGPNGDGDHHAETIGFVAIEKGLGRTDDLSYEVGLTPNRVTDRWYTIRFVEPPPLKPIFFAQANSEKGSDPADVRYRRLGRSSVQISMREEQSLNEETTHKAETVVYFMMEDAGFLYGR